MHPWERDARLVKEAMKKGPEVYGVIVEIACTRSSEELLGARKAYHSLFDHSIEEDVAYHIDGPESKVNTMFLYTHILDWDSADSVIVMCNGTTQDLEILH